MVRFLIVRLSLIAVTLLVVSLAIFIITEILPGDVATMMLRQGIHPKVVQERLGHSTIAITLDVYSHVTAGLQEAAALRFEEALAAESPVPAPEPAGTIS